MIFPIVGDRICSSTEATVEEAPVLEALAVAEGGGGGGGSNSGESLVGGGGG